MVEERPFQRMRAGYTPQLQHKSVFGDRLHSVSSTHSKEARKTMSVNVTPLHDRILIKRVEEKETVKGGIIVPDTAKEKPQEGEVVAVGNGKILENGTKVPLDVKAGDKILFGKYSGTDIKIDGQEYLILREDEVLAIVG